MTILDEIVAYKKVFVEKHKQQIPLDEILKAKDYKRSCYSLSESLLHPDRTGIIAEFKKQSPSKGVINAGVKPEEVTKAYADNGASALSVLTDEKYFGGCDEDVMAARAVNRIPVLRKEFIVDEYQIHRAKAIGADAILLIAACLSIGETKAFAKLANSLGLEVLLEVHNEQELEHVNDQVQVVGVNNRNLKTFEVSIDTSIQLAKMIPDGFVKISESGISNIENIITLKKHGFKGFLIGENFMKTENPGETFKRFAQALKKA